MILSEKKTFCYTATYLRCITCTTKAAEGVLEWVCKTTGSGDGSPPAGSTVGALVGGSGDEVRQKLKNFKSSYKQILRIFW